MSLAIADIAKRCQSCGHLLRRSEPEPRYLVAGPLTLDLERWTATIGGRAVEFAGPDNNPAVREWELLLVLARQAGRLVPRADLIRTVYGWADGAAARHALTMCAVRLRSRLGEYGALIVTHRGRGLRLDMGGAP